ncbi:MAG: hypothetical protein HC820_07730 [Hydrococcus sp. RM1_1_31]|nr:hypothetical protein [Hydrococcus sp. RM1_1_31]
MAQSSNSSNTNNSQNEVGGIEKSLLATARGTVTFATTSVGATLAFPIMLFNAATTVVGAGLILPVGIGYPIGVLLSFIYIIVVSFRKIKREHPLRRMLLVSLFAIGSTYTSFFSIYETMTEGQLKYQSVEKTVKAHNQFVDDLRGQLDRKIGQIEKKNPKIREINNLQEEYEKTKNSAQRIFIKIQK